ncbi:hypothetical protein TNCT_379021 [Trichonephila clavata]|uniref:Uncharacterized protein n=1 Tax=Trichonephila clavata TaxID=2740835 RepID=A0A8X6I7A1_TRICU|nr:hypothetical protein TNCT_379021 [Trichonephila clavata]
MQISPNQLTPYRFTEPSSSSAFLTPSFSTTQIGRPPKEKQKTLTPTFSLQGQTSCPFIRCPKSKQAPIDKNQQARGKKLQHLTRQVSHLPTGRRGG